MDQNQQCQQNANCRGILDFCSLGVCVYKIFSFINVPIVALILLNGVFARLQQLGACPADFMSKSNVIKERKQEREEV